MKGGGITERMRKKPTLSEHIHKLKKVLFLVKKIMKDVKPIKITLFFFSILFTNPPHTPKVFVPFLFSIKSFV